MPRTPAKKARKTAAKQGAAKPAAKVARKLVAKVDPTKPHAARADSGASIRRPAIPALIRRAQGSLPMAMLRRFIDADLLAHSAALAFYAVLSLAPLLLILLWLTAQFVPGTQEAFMQQVVLLGGGDAERLARAIIEMPQGRRLYLERAAVLLTNAFKVEWLTNRVNQLLTQLRPALAESARREMERHASVVTERIIRRTANLAKQLSEPELKPLRVDKGIARMSAWRPVDVPDGGKLEQAKAPDGRAALRISAGPVTSASWRAKVLLQTGRYRFEGASRTAGVKPLPFGKNKGAGLRVSSAKAAGPHQLTGDSPWIPLSIDFELTAPETEVELLCELRASAGEAWFDLESLRLVQVK